MTRFTLRDVLVAAILGIQIGGIVAARFTPTRFLAWAPYDQMSFYRIEVERNSRLLEPHEVSDRYRMPAAARENRSIHHVLAAIAQYERTYGVADPVRVRVTYRVNGRDEQTWSLPQ
jgi:hypothetical protein